MLSFRFPSCDCEHSSDHVFVAHAEFLMNFRTRQICLSFTESDNVILQQATETIHASNFQHPLYSQPVGLGLLVEHLTSGAEHPTDILADARDLAFDAFEVLPLLH